MPAARERAAYSQGTETVVPAVAENFLQVTAAPDLGGLLDVGSGSAKAAVDAPAAWVAGCVSAGAGFGVSTGLWVATSLAGGAFLTMCFLGTRRGRSGLATLLALGVFTGVLTTSGV